MPTITFEDSAGAATVVEAPDGGAIVDLCDANATSVQFSCRSASCATCRIQVLEGGELLLEPGDEELAILDVFGADPRTQRLACQAKLLAGPGRVRVRPAED